VPYRGTGPALRDLQESKADLMCDQTANTAEPIRGGRIRALGVAAPRRLQGMPSVPTAAEAGIRGLELSIWHGLFAPAGTPPDVVQRLAQALQAALVTPAFVRAMDDLQVVVVSREKASPVGLGTLLSSEIARWAPILRKAGQYAD
jgi:tripartite-type tricarboxylate transporter receptor subunit TctC